MYRSIVGVAVLAASALGSLAGRPASEAVTFRVRVENVSGADTLKTSQGSVPAAVAPVLYVVHTGKNPVFAAGQKDRGQGLEALAEEGNPSALAAALTAASGVSAAGVQDTPVGASAPGPIVGGSAYEFSVTAVPGGKLTLAMMFGQSNDLFYAPADGIPLFRKGKPLQGDITASFTLWDAGTEMNQEPGVGADQAPRQAAPDTGPAENGTVRLLRDVKDGFKYPSVADVLRVTIVTAGPGTTM